MKTVAIAGVGLIGGSFALAIRRSGFKGRILGVSSPSTIAEALELGIIDEGATLEAACAQADLIYLAQPILRIVQILSQIGPLIRPGTLVTDAGSTKALIVETAKAHLPPGSFLGGHPMAGKETRGLTAADGDLFLGRPYVLTPQPKDVLETGPAQSFLSMIAGFGAVPVVLEPEDHDRLTAYTSHLPQLISSSLALTLASQPQSERVAGPAAKELTRLASSGYEMWRDIFYTNPINIRAAVLSFIEILEGFAQHLESDLESEFRKSADAARAIRNHR